MKFWKKKKEDTQDFTEPTKEESLKPFEDTPLEEENSEEENALQETAASNSRKKGIFIIMSLVVIVLMVGILTRAVISKKDNAEATESAADTQQQDKNPFTTAAVSGAGDGLPDIQASEPVAMTASAPGFGEQQQAIAMEQTAGTGDTGMQQSIPVATEATAATERPATPRQMRLAAGLMTGGSGGTGGQPVSGSSGDDSTPQPINNSSSGGLGGLLEPTLTTGSMAGSLGNRNLMMVKGTFIPCYLKTRLDTQVMGMTSCVIPRDIYSANGKVILLEKGSEVTGEFQQSAAMGMNRIFVLWTRIVTPRGVYISVDSPATDSLGGSGIRGKVNNHWFKRFGNALLFSMIQDGMESGFNRLAKNGKDDNSGNVVYSNTKDSSDEIVKEILKSTSNIPPTIYKNQGEPVGIYLARDLNFSTVYRLRSKYIGGHR